MVDADSHSQRQVPLKMDFSGKCGPFIVPGTAAVSKVLVRKEFWYSPLLRTYHASWADCHPTHRPPGTWGNNLVTDSPKQAPWSPFSRHILLENRECSIEVCHIDSYLNWPVVSLVPFCDDSSSASRAPRSLLCRSHFWGDRSQVLPVDGCSDLFSSPHVVSSWFLPTASMILCPTRPPGVHGSQVTVEALGLASCSASDEHAHPSPAGEQGCWNSR